MSALALLRNPSRIAAARSTVAWLGNAIMCWLRLSAKIGKDRRTLHGLRDYMLEDLGLERLETRTTLEGERVWVHPKRF